MGNLKDLGLEAVKAEEPRYQLLPAGRYKAQVVGAAWRLPKESPDEYIEIKWAILDTRFKDTVHYQRLFVNTSKSEVGQRIARGRLKKLLTVARCDLNGDIEQLLRAPAMLITVKITEARNGYDEQNEITNVEPIQPSQQPVAVAPVVGANWQVEIGQKFQEDVPF